MAGVDKDFEEPAPKRKRPILRKTDSEFDPDIELLDSYGDKEDLAQIFSTAKLKEWRDTSSGQTSPQITDQDIIDYETLITQFPVTTKCYRLLPKAENKLPHFFPKFLSHNINLINSRPKASINRKDEKGRGGYGVVYSGTWTVNNQSTLAAFKSTSSHDTQDFDQELSILRKLDHVSVVTFLGSCIHESVRYIVMEMCDGNLDQYVHGQLQNIPKDAVKDRKILGQMALGLGYLHGRDPPIIHKDLKPQNVLLQKRPELILAKLTDFGFSRQRPADQDDFNPTDRQGTTGFVSPELLQTTIPSPESDVWAFGATVFYVISGGQHPHEITGVSRTTNGNLRNYFIIKFKMAPNMAAISDHLPAADLTHRLLCYVKEQRPSIFLVLHHPYFSLAQDKTHEYLSKKISDFLRAQRPDGSRYVNRQLFTFDNLQKWYEALDKTDETEEELKENESYINQLRKLMDDAPATTNESPRKLLSLIKESMKDQVNSQSKLDLLVLRRRQDLNLLNLSSSRLLVSFIWSTLMSLGLSREQYRDHFQMSELEFGLVHHRPEFFEEIWSLRNGQLSRSEVDNLLSVAAALNLPEFVHLLLTKGADPNFVDSNGYTALFHAATHEAPNLKVIKLLLDHGADPNVQDRHGTTLLRHMNVIYYPDIVRMLLDKGADPNRGPQGWTPLANLIRFSSAKCVPIIKLLLDRGANPNVLDHNGKPMLNLIIQRGDVEMLQALLDKGATTDHVDDHGRTFLHHAISCKKVESIASIIRLLLEKGIDPKSKDLDGRTAIDYATDVNVELVQMLIGQEADPELEVNHQQDKPRKNLLTDSI